MLTINDRDRIPWQEGMTVQDVLDAMNYTYKLIAVTLDDEPIPAAEFELRSVPDEARITVFHLAHGG